MRLSCCHSRPSAENPCSSQARTNVGSAASASAACQTNCRCSRVQCHCSPEATAVRCQTNFQAVRPGGGMPVQPGKGTMVARATRLTCPALHAPQTTGSAATRRVAAGYGRHATKASGASPSSLSSSWC
eukprot:3023471-Prymnesium_polylepis.4